MTDAFTIGSELLKTEDKCCICNSKKNLEPHHIIPVNKYDDFYNDVNNVVIICNKCHHNYHQKNMGNINFKSLLQFKGEFERDKCKKLKKKYGALHKYSSNLKKIAKLKGVDLE